jgi:hypothetical protein
VHQYREGKIAICGLKVADYGLSFSIHGGVLTRLKAVDTLPGQSEKKRKKPQAQAAALKPTRFSRKYAPSSLLELCILICG